MRQLLLLPFAFSISVFAGCTIPADIGCTSDDECREGRICVDNACVWADGEGPDNNGSQNGSANNGSQNNGSQNNGSPNNDPQNNGAPNNPQNNGSPNNGSQNNEAPNSTSSDPDIALCAEFCDLLFGSCVEQQCELGDDRRAQLGELYEICMWEGFDGDPGCVDSVRNDPGAREGLRDLLDTVPCDGEELQQFRCQEIGLVNECDCPQSGGGGIGSSCGSNGDCDGAGLPAICVDEFNDPPFPGGYCVSIGCDVGDQGQAAYDDLCGEENVCIAVGGPGSNEGVCFDGCSTHAACRADYQCRLIGVDGGGIGGGGRTALRVCLPQCGDDSDCGQNERCNAGRCELTCEGSGNGGTSRRARCNALGFSCETDANGQEWCVMP